MTNVDLTPGSSKYPSESVLIESIQDELTRLSQFISDLSRLPEEELAALEISDQLFSVHRCLTRFENRCRAVRYTGYENDFADPFLDTEGCTDPAVPNSEWREVRKEVKRAGRLTNQLTQTLTRIRSGLGGFQTQSTVPDDVRQIGRCVTESIDGLISEWNSLLD